MPQKGSVNAILRARPAPRGIVEMPENSKFFSDQEMDELSGLFDGPVAPEGMSKELRDVAEWFVPADTANADLEVVLGNCPARC